MHCLVCNGPRAVPQPAFASVGMPFKVFLPEDQTYNGCRCRETATSRHENEHLQPQAEVREYIGTIIAYHAGNGAASLQLDGALSTGERIVVVEKGEEQEIEVEWIQWGKAWIHLALRGWMITIPSTERLSTGSQVFRAT